MGDFFDIEALFPQLVLALGLALIVGNGFAWWKHRKGDVPKGVPEASYRRGRVRWLTLVGVILTFWGAVSLFS